jgi:hypothetical protein
MKKLILLFCLVATGMVAQTTQTINSQLKLNTVPVGSTNDSLLVHGSDKLVKKLSKAALFATIPTPTLHQVTTSGSTTTNPATFNGGVTVMSPLTLTGPSTLTLNAESASEFKLRNSSNVPIFGAGGSSIFFTDSGGFSSTIKSLSKTAHQNYLLPNQSGTFALSEYTVGDFINDGATTMAPSQNAVFDALALKANSTDVSLQSMVDSNSTYVEVDGGNSSMELLAGSTDNRSAYIDIYGDGQSAGWSLDKTRMMAQSFTTAGAAKLELINGEVKLQRTNHSVSPQKITTVSIDYPAANTVINFPAKPVDGTYTVATTDTTANLTGNQSISGTKTFLNSIQCNNSILIEDVTSGGYGQISNDEDNVIFYASPNSPNGIANQAYIILAPNNIGIKSTSGTGFGNINASNIGSLSRAAKLIDANGDIPLIRTTAPTSSTAAGVKGEIYVDANYIYYCYATNSWRRTAGSSF